MPAIIEKKDNKIFLVAVASSIILIGAVLAVVVFSLGDKDKKTENPAASLPPKEKTMEEIIQSFSASPKSGEKPIPVSGEVLESFSAAPVSSTANPKNNKITQPVSSSAPIPENILKSFSAQSSKK